MRPSIDSIIQIAKEASSLMLTDTFEISQKGSCSNIVTSSDLAVQDFLCKRLSTLIPGCGFICEEEDMWDNTHEYTWIIDPIDGTANYSRGITQCAVCIGLKHNAEIIMGVVYLPMANELFYAEKGKGAFMNNKKIHVSDRTFNNSIMATALPVYHKEYAGVCSEIILETFAQCNDIRRFGACAPELCYLAMGRCELYFEYLLSTWDFAAASLILTEAGGVITNLKGEPLDFKEASGVVAGNSRKNHSILLDIVKRHTSEQ